MKNIKRLIALTTVMALCASQAQSQNYDGTAYDGTVCDDSAAYYDCGRASYWSAAIPVGAIVVAAIIIASTNNHHHHSSSGGGGNNNSRSRSLSSSSCSSSSSFCHH